MEGLDDSSPCRGGVVIAKAQVELFLQQFRRYWPPNCVVIPREKNNQALADLGIMPVHRRDIILELRPENYSAGPTPDDGGSGEDVWIFGSRLDEVELYIKLLVKAVESGFTAKCLSFHPAELPLSYPFKGRGRSC
jgi:hypothetical protein